VCGMQIEVMRVCLNAYKCHDHHHYHHHHHHYDSCHRNFKRKHGCRMSHMFPSGVAIAGSISNTYGDDDDDADDADDDDDGGGDNDDDDDGYNKNSNNKDDDDDDNQVLVLTPISLPQHPFDTATCHHMQTGVTLRPCSL
jgi:hypothetical protein